MPFTPQVSNGSTDINAGPGGAVRPDLVGNPTLTSGQTIQHWFNVSAFAVPHTRIEKKRRAAPEGDYRV
jgi:hypothetical protein